MRPNETLDLFYNIVRYSLTEYFKMPVVPLKYGSHSAVFTADIKEGPSNLDVYHITARLLDQIEKVDYLYDFKDPKSLFFHYPPVLKKNTFYYNPFSKLVPTFDKEQIKKIFMEARVSRKSRSLRVSVEGLEV